ncbi:MAG TPA: histidine phosphatase family protein [Candidatus Limnocylindria bacterium]|nr:histidine phosphatase family protein [Candidatus Limnocylindria bacterium]
MSNRPHLFVARHGNVDHSTQSLSPEGRDGVTFSAAKFAAFLGDELSPRTAIYTSELDRAIQTGEVFAEELGVDPGKVTQVGILSYLTEEVGTPEELVAGAQEILGQEASARTPQVLMVGHMTEVSLLAFGTGAEHVKPGKIYPSYLNNQ